MNHFFWIKLILWLRVRSLLDGGQHTRPTVLAKWDTDRQQVNHEYLTSCVSLEMYHEHTHWLHGHKNARTQWLHHTFMNMYIQTWTNMYTHAAWCQCCPVSWCNAICRSITSVQLVSYKSIRSCEHTEEIPRSHFNNTQIVSSWRVRGSAMWQSHNLNSIHVTSFETQRSPSSIILSGAGQAKATWQE